LFIGNKKKTGTKLNRPTTFTVVWGVLWLHSSTDIYYNLYHFNGTYCIWNVHLYCPLMYLEMFKLEKK